MLLLLFAQSIHGEQANKKIIQNDKKSIATILSISAKPLSVRVRFTNKTSHTVELFRNELMLQRKGGNQWESLFRAIKDDYGVTKDTL